MLPVLRMLAIAILLPDLADLQTIDPTIVGTWTSKSGKVLTGPVCGFYDPVNEVIFEPKLTGISYSFTSDGFYEESLFRAISNGTQPVQNYLLELSYIPSFFSNDPPATTPSCPSGIIQWQHGHFTSSANGTLILTPIAVDGRQLLSRPCTSSTATFTRYNQTELFSSYEVLTDPYNGRLRLNLFQWDGTPVNPMWLAYRPPEMLPTVTLNPTATGTASASATGRRKVRRAMDGWRENGVRMADGARFHGRGWKTLVDAELWLWVGLGMTGIGGLLVICF